MAAPWGMRFYHLVESHLGSEFGWYHSAEVPPFLTDCTDMTDDEFERYVTSRAPSPQP